MDFYRDVPTKAPPQNALHARLKAEWDTGLQFLALRPCQPVAEVGLSMIVEVDLANIFNNRGTGWYRKALFDNADAPVRGSCSMPRSDSNSLALVGFVARPLLGSFEPVGF
jgi:hypothetical protein